LNDDESYADKLTALHNILQVQEKALKILEKKQEIANIGIESPVNEKVETQISLTTNLRNIKALDGQNLDSSVKASNFDIYENAQDNTGVETEKNETNLCDVKINTNSKILESGFKSFDLSFQFGEKEILLETAGRSENFPILYKVFSLRYLQAVLQNFVEANSQVGQSYENFSRIINKSIDEILDKVKQLLEFHTRENVSYDYVDYVQPAIESMQNIQVEFNANVSQKSDNISLKKIDLLRSLVIPHNKIAFDDREGYEALVGIMCDEESDEEVCSKNSEMKDLNLKEIFDILETRNITVAQILEKMDQHPASLGKSITYSDKFPIKKYPVKNITEGKKHTDKGFNIMFQSAIRELLYLGRNTKLSTKDLVNILNNKYCEQNNIQLQKPGATYNNSEEIMKLHNNGSGSNSFGGFGCGRSRTGNNPKVMGTRWKDGMSSNPPVSKPKTLLKK
jgi:hypothetical protein